MRRDVKMLKEVRIGTFINDENRVILEPITCLELDPNSTMTVICDVEGNVATDIVGNQYYIIKKDSKNRIKKSELTKITKGIPYVISINQRVFSTTEKKHFYENLKTILEIKNKYMQVDKFLNTNDLEQNNKKRKIK